MLTSLWDYLADWQMHASGRSLSRFSTRSIPVYEIFTQWPCADGRLEARTREFIANKVNAVTNEYSVQFAAEGSCAATVRKREA